MSYYVVAGDAVRELRWKSGAGEGIFQGSDYFGEEAFQWEWCYC